MTPAEILEAYIYRKAYGRNEALLPSIWGQIYNYHDNCNNLENVAEDLLILMSQTLKEARNGKP